MTQDPIERDQPRGCARAVQLADRPGRGQWAALVRRSPAKVSIVLLIAIAVFVAFLAALVKNLYF